MPLWVRCGACKREVNVSRCVHSPDFDPTVAYFNIKTVQIRYRNLLVICKQLTGMELVVEAAGVEPASENVTGQETTCLVQFPLPELPGNLRSSCSERTRNRSR